MDLLKKIFEHSQIGKKSAVGIEHMYIPFMDWANKKLVTNDQPHYISFNNYNKKIRVWELNQIWKSKESSLHMSFSFK